MESCSGLRRAARVGHRQASGGRADRCAPWIGAGSGMVGRIRSRDRGRPRPAAADWRDRARCLSVALVVESVLRAGSTGGHGWRGCRSPPGSAPRRGESRRPPAGGSEWPRAAAATPAPSRWAASRTGVAVRISSARASRANSTNPAPHVPRPARNGMPTAAPTRPPAAPQGRDWPCQWWGPLSSSMSPAAATSRAAPPMPPGRARPRPPGLAIAGPAGGRPRSERRPRPRTRTQPT